MAAKKKSDFIDIKGLLKEYRSKWLYFAISIIVICGATYLFLKTQNPVYNVRANVLVSDESNSATKAALGDLGSLIGSKSKVDDEIFLITSHSLYKDVAKKLGIYRTHIVKQGFLKKQLAFPEFPVDANFPESIQDTIKSTFKISAKVDKSYKADITVKCKGKTIAEKEGVSLPAVLETPYGPITVDTTAYYPKGREISTVITITGFDSAAEDISKLVSASIAAKKANVIALSLNTDNTDYGIDILNSIIDLYNIRGVLEKNAQGEKTADFIDRRLEILNSGLSESESEIQAYKQDRGIIDIRSEAEYQTIIRGKAEEALMEAMTKGEILTITKDFLALPENNLSLVPFTTSSSDSDESSDNKGVTDYNKLILERMTLAKSATGNNRALADLDDQIASMRSNLISQLERQIAANDVIVKDLRHEMSSAKGQLSKVPLQEREFRDLTRQQEVKQKLYVFLLQRREETAMMLANALPKAIIIDEAFSYSKPIGLSKMAILLIAFFIALCIPPCIFYIKKLTRTQFGTREDVESIIDVPVLGEITTSKAGRTLIATPGSNSSAAELFRLMRTKLLFIIDGKKTKVVSVTSSHSGEGKSFVSINLASSLSLIEGKKVLLIGMDLRKPTLGDYLDISPRFGLSQYLSSSEVTLESIITPVPGLARLDVIVAGPIPPNPGELLMSDKLDRMMETLKERYDYIVIDTAPIGKVSDSYVINRLSDATMFVVRANHTTISELRKVDVLAEEDRLVRMSVIVNGTPRTVDYGYGNDQ